jgi:MFS transporter, ACS family, tartrate transporter
MPVAPTASIVSNSDFKAAAMRKFRWRMIPLLAICYFIYRLDLLNVGFAGVTMNRELGLSATAFGFGVGVFYWGFFLCQIAVSPAPRQCSWLGG